MKEKWKNFHRAQLNTSRGPWESKRTRKIPAEPGRTKERRKRKRRGSGMGPATWGGHESEEQSPHPGNPSSGNSVSTEGEPHSLWERTRQLVWQQDRVRPALPTQPERHAHRCRQGLGAEMWGSESRPRQRIEVSFEETS